MQMTESTGPRKAIDVEVSDDVGKGGAKYV